MKRYLVIILIVLFWMLTNINTSGWGVYNETLTKTNFLIFIWFLWEKRRREGFAFSVSRHLLLIVATIISFVIIPYFTVSSWDGLVNLMLIPYVYCLSCQRVEQMDIKVSSFIIALLGLATLYIYDRTELLSGWNDNQIGMIGLFSYVFYTMSLYGDMSFRKATLGVAISILYTYMLMEATESRSTAIFVIIAAAFVFSNSFVRKIASLKYFIPIAVSVPLIIAIAAVLTPENSLFGFFDEWSMENYGKTGFNGRNEIWLYTFQHLPNTYFLGDGEFLINHHNSAMAVLGCFGVLGYVCWFVIFNKVTKLFISDLKDSIVLGSLMAFFIIFWQQSFDLGFITPTPNMIPYTILGLGLARINTIRRYGIN